ncbi:hypothetical protein GE09DRAFT_1060096 [Coniochaeta sp. 2T2.1]|nr:hypothetical protein GE09DRAFT_1060096 [Coniochaeta sp. 2T2.1]
MSSSSMPSAKRRRVDAATETLKKPFRSPMVKRPQAPSGTGITAGSPVTPAPIKRQQDVDLSRLSTPSKIPDRRRPGPALSTATNRFGTPSKPAPRRGAATPFSQRPSSTLQGIDDKDAALLDNLQRRRREAEIKTREVEKEVELIKQAARIESGKETTNEEMRALVRKWKAACRVAAEELFELIRGRVDSMGGGAAWRETRQQNVWFEDEEIAEERRRRKENGEGADEREELEGLEEVEEKEEVEESEERDFTMHMMLKSLNIDPKTIGYDAAEDKWRDWG